jgi:hypothetical protein
VPAGRQEAREHLPRMLHRVKSKLDLAHRVAELQPELSM